MTTEPYNPRPSTDRHLRGWHADRGRGKPREDYGQHRSCADCGTTLARHNRGPICYHCEERLAAAMVLADQTNNRCVRCDKPRPEANRYCTQDCYEAALNEEVA